MTDREREIGESYEMATIQASCNNINTAEEDYIDMEVSSSSSSSTLFCYSISSPPQTREFEFQMSSSVSDNDIELTTSPADVLFYKGKLLPLHLPPRLQMVQNILQTASNDTINKPEQGFEATYINPSFITAGSTTPSTNTSTSTPLESCNISPSESCRVSCELNEYFSEWANEMSVFIGDHHHPKKSWSTKLKQIKQSSLGQKIKQSRAYLKSLFSKSSCNSDGSCAKRSCNNIMVEEERVSSRGKDSLNKYVNVVGKKNPFGRITTNGGRYQISSSSATTLMKSLENDQMADIYQVEGGLLNSQRRSFSGVIQRHYSTTSSTSSSGSSSSSSSFSFSSNGSYNDAQFLKRSSSANSELESSIEGAIAHCKQSHQLVRKNGGNQYQSGDCSLSAASRIINGVCGDQERPGLCRI
ncbi:hypothetical protein FNV43_RR15961 [Rhamnella rubrinervis]|uniref:Membrane-associated kinase regulator 4 n=1 Tax=Rhamnella rubrinervis TaxID=2594499 RepID=A0A8K0GYF0_9ROSA|nr:hypothetical protein FNV43_RR15961 [Rhamnella rubrinervis]